MTITKIPLTLLGTQPAEKDGHRFTYVAANNAIELVSPTDAVFSISEGGGGGSGPYAYGSTSAYLAGGYQPTGSPVFTAGIAIAKFSFASVGPASSVGDLVDNRLAGVGSSSSTHGYAFKGILDGATNSEKFPFSSDTDSAVVGTTLSAQRWSGEATGPTAGYAMGEFLTPTTGSDAIEKILFTSDVNEQDVGELTAAKNGGAGAASSTNGYLLGSTFVGPGAYSNDVEKFPFASDVSSTDVASISPSMSRCAGHNSDTHGYLSGGVNPSPTLGQTSIQKINFSSDSNSTTVGALVTGVYRHGGVSSTTSGYALGGRTAAATHIDDIQQFSFSSDSNASDIGEVGFGSVTGWVDFHTANS